MSAAMNFPTTSMSKVPPTELLRDVNQDRPVVLVVDDEKMIADTLSLILNQFGFATMTAYDAKTALEIAAVIPPELLICELAMPKMNGFDLAQKVTTANPDCSVVLLSGRANPVPAMNSSNETDFVLLNKPIHPTALLAEIPEPLKKRSRRFRTHLMVSEDMLGDRPLSIA